MRRMRLHETFSCIQRSNRLEIAFRERWLRICHKLRCYRFRILIPATISRLLCILPWSARTLRSRPLRLVRHRAKQASTSLILTINQLTVNLIDKPTRIIKLHLAISPAVLGVRQDTMFLSSRNGNVKQSPFLLQFSERSSRKRTWEDILFQTNHENRRKLADPWLHEPSSEKHEVHPYHHRCQHRSAALHPAESSLQESSSNLPSSRRSSTKAQTSSSRIPPGSIDVARSSATLPT